MGVLLPGFEVLAPAGFVLAKDFPLHTLAAGHQPHPNSLPMNNRELARTTCFDNMSAFGKAKTTDLADAAPDSDGKKKAKAKARAKFGELSTLIAAIDTEIAKEQSGGKKQGTTSRGVLRDALTSDLREWNRTAAAIAEDLQRPEIADAFRMPHGNNDTELAGTARAFIKSVTDLALHDAFVEHGLEDDFEDALDERITDFETSQDTQSAAGQAASGAVDALDELVKTGMSLRKSLDALVHNLFKANATIIGEWATASHVERQGARKAKTQTPTSPQPTTPKT